MSEIRMVLDAGPRRPARLPELDAAQQAVRAAAASGHVVARGAPGSGRTTCALAVLGDAARAGTAMMWAPDRSRVDRLEPAAQALAPSSVRPVRTPAAFAYLVVSTWRTRRGDPLGPVQLVTGAQEDQLLEVLLARGGIDWPDSMPERMRAMPAFRMELRNLFARAGEAGIGGPALADLGRALGRPAWVAAGELLGMYEGGPGFSLDSRESMSADTSRIQRLAALVLDRWDQDAAARGVVAPPPLPEAVVVDDLQDCTASTVELLTVMARLGVRVAAFSDPDVAVASYRGGEPHLDLRLAGLLGTAPRELGAVHRGTAALRRLARDVTGRITTSGPAGRRVVGVATDAAPDGGAAEGGEESLHVHLAASDAQLGALVARLLRTHHLHDGVAWDDQVVIVRSSRDVDQVRRHLARGGVPLSGRRRAFAFSVEPSTRVLLALIASALPVPDTAVGAGPGAALVDADAGHGRADAADDERTALLLLDSPYVDADPLDIHRVLRALNTQVVAQGSGEDADEDAADVVAPGVGLVDLLERPELADAAAGADLAAQIHRAGRIWAVRQGLWRDRPRHALWALWQAADVAERWSDGARAGGEDAPWFDDQLDAVIALFRVADVWEQRTPAGLAGDFARGLLADQVPVDTLARTGQRPAGVEVLTPAQAMGAQWDVVCVLGLQDGRWPNPRLRDRMLRADVLVDVGAGRLGQDDLGHPVVVENPRVARRAVLDDETRLFAAAITRSRRYLHLGAVRAEEEAPSSLIGVCLPHTPEGHARGDGRPADPAEVAEPEVSLERVRPPLDLAGQAATLRHLAAQPQDSPRRDLATTLLAVLAHQGVVQADPSRWTGAGGVTTDAVTVGSEPLALSPSRVQTAEQCPLKWFFAQSGAGAPAGGAQRLGTLVHAIAQRHPHGTEDQMLADLHEHWEVLGYDESTWVGQYQRARAERTVRALAQYVAGHPGDVRTEVPVRVPVEDVLLTGSIDRVESGDDGVSVVDLKTGSTAVSVAEALEHPQLATYQVALLETGSRVVGARLVFLGSGKPAERVQPALQGEDLRRWKDTLRDLGVALRGPLFPATPSDAACRTCPFRRSCPAMDQGRRTLS